jgi:hypothetical protein
MAKLVMAAGVPHPPRLVFEMQQAPGKTKGETLMKQVREQVEKAEPDLIIEVDSDHFVNFSITTCRPFASAWPKRKSPGDLVSDAALHGARPCAARQGAVQVRRR